MTLSLSLSRLSLDRATIHTAQYGERPSFLPAFTYQSANGFAFVQLGQYFMINSHSNRLGYSQSIAYCRQSGSRGQ